MFSSIEYILQYMKAFVNRQFHQMNKLVHGLHGIVV